MGKPSIFSKDYERRMKRRRKGIAVFCVVALLAGVIFLTFGSGSISKWIGNSNINKWTQEQKKVEPDTKKQANSAQKSEADNIKKTEEQSNGSYDVSLSNGVTVKAVYENTNGTKRFKYIEPVSSNVIYSINTSGSAIVLYDSSAQNIIYVDINGKNIDLTRQNYTSTQGTVYAKGDVLTNNPNYIWCTSPTFIDDQNIAYVSELPWFNGQNIKYIWIVNSSDATQRQVLNSDGSDLSGQNIKFGTVSDKGLTVTIDDKNYYIRSDGSVTE